jgi:hypothetical protein
MFMLTAKVNSSLVTNKNDEVNVWPAAPWSDGTQVCNIFYPDSDCQTVQGGKFNLNMKNGEVKMFLPKSSSFFKTEEEAKPEFVQA